MDTAREVQATFELGFTPPVVVRHPIELLALSSYTGHR